VGETGSSLTDFCLILSLAFVSALRFSEEGEGCAARFFCIAVVKTENSSILSASLSLHTGNILEWFTHLGCPASR
jgi:hypothetical protein